MWSAQQACPCLLLLSPLHVRHPSPAGTLSLSPWMTILTMGWWLDSCTAPILLIQILLTSSVLFHRQFLIFIWIYIFLYYAFYHKPSFFIWLVGYQQHMAVLIAITISIKSFGNEKFHQSWQKANFSFFSFCIIVDQ